MKKIYSFILGAALAGTALAQNPAGSALFISLDEYNAGDPVKYVLCGNSSAFNTGAELTLEGWFAPETTSGNQKFMGKTNGNFNSGYVLAFKDGRIYPEIWNPTNNTMEEGLVLPNGYWVHWAVTFSAGGDMIGYINGQNVGSITVPNNNIASNTNDFVIGIAPWDLANFQFFGQMDEVAVWNVARTEEEIIGSLHTGLQGNENGLVAYYDFNDGSGTTLTDQSSNGNTGSLINFTDDWVDSQAPIASAETQEYIGITAIWNGLNTNPSFATTTQGLSMTAFLTDHDYAIWAYGPGMGVTTDDIPAGTPGNFERLDREWSVTAVGDVAADLNFNLFQGANNGLPLANGEPAQNYTLLYRADTTSDFTIVAAANSYNGTVAQFNGVELENGYYTVGVGEQQVASPSAVEERRQIANMRVAPNPSTGMVTIELNALAGSDLTVVDAMGKIVWQQRAGATQGKQVLDLQHLSAGVYFLRATSDTAIATERIVIE